MGTGGTSDRRGGAPAAIWAARRPCLAGTGTGGAGPLQIPKPDSYSLRLMSGRRLYDAGSSVTGSPSLTPLVPTLVARANPYDLDRLGAKTGDRVKVRSARGELILAAEADEGVARGVVAIDFNVPGGESAPPNAVATLIDSRQLGDRRATGVGVIAADALLSTAGRAGSSDPSC